MHDKVGHEKERTMKTFQNKVAAVTGAGSGIGQQLAVQLAKRGCDVAISDINEDGLKQTEELLSAYNVKVSTYKLDVSDKQQMRDWASSVVQQHGKVNLIFNNAGVALGTTVEGATYEEYEWIMGINFWGVVYGTKEFLPYIKDTKDGYVVNISSLFGLTAQPTQSAYNATKFAVRGFTESLAQELDIEKCGVKALSVHPGGIRTNIANSARMNDSVNKLGMGEASAEKFNKLLRFPPEDAANLILDAVKNNQRRLLIGNDAKVMDVLQRVMPSGYQRVTALLSKLG